MTPIQASTVLITTSPNDTLVYKALVRSVKRLFILTIPILLCFGSSEGGSGLHFDEVSFRSKVMGFTIISSVHHPHLGADNVLVHDRPASNFSVILFIACRITYIPISQIIQ